LDDQGVAFDVGLQAGAVEQLGEGGAQIGGVAHAMRLQAGDQFGGRNQLQAGGAGELAQGQAEALGGLIEGGGGGVAAEGEQDGGQQGLASFHGGTVLVTVEEKKGFSR